MTQGLTATQTKLLTWLVYALMIFLTSVSVAHTIQFMNMPSSYVLLERYKSDGAKNAAILYRIETKLDKLIMEDRK